MGQKSETTSYVPMSFEEFYQRKLNMYCALVRALIFDTVYVAPSAKACPKPCECRIMVWIGGYEYDKCIRCYKIRSRDSRALDQLLKEYPSREQCLEHWQPPKPEPRKEIAPERAAFGIRVEEARVALGWTQKELASRIVKPNGQTFSHGTIKAVELGAQGASQYLKGKLEEVLGLRQETTPI